MEMKHILYRFNEDYNAYEYVSTFYNRDEALDYAYIHDMDNYYITDEVDSVDGIIAQNLKQSLQDKQPRHIKLDSRVEVIIDFDIHGIYTHLNYQGKSVHRYNIDGQIYNRYYFDEETFLDNLAVELLHDLRKYLKHDTK